MVHLLLQTLASIALLSSDLQAMPPPPQRLCQSGCTQEMRRMSEAFDSATGLSPVTGDHLYSGICLMRGENYNPEITHYGVVYFDLYEGEAHNHGQFGFFHKTNPYEKWTSEDFRKNVPLTYSEDSILHLESDYAWVDYRPKDPVNIWQYYYRQMGDHLYVIAHWGRRHTLFCELSLNL